MTSGAMSAATTAVRSREASITPDATWSGARVAGVSCSLATVSRADRLRGERNCPEFALYSGTAAETGTLTEYLVLRFFHAVRASRFLGIREKNRSLSVSIPFAVFSVPRGRAAQQVIFAEGSQEGDSSRSDLLISPKFA
jgi:hypothetical protein